MQFPLIIEPEAEGDLANAYRWYERQCAGLGREFLHCIEEVLQRLRQAPETHAVAYKNVRQTLTKRFPYVVCYTFEQEQVHVMAVFHGRVSWAPGSGRVDVSRG